ncbi:MAG: sulfatase-like hydrolase/transferase [Prosthecobacter sp.]|nr:sulfatase-like hydrolase/transferase [Prosthecobacter sp.]
MLRCFFLTCLTFWLQLSLSAGSQEKPDIVFILADDLGWADVAFHGGHAPTPHLDRLRQDGVELTHHYVAPVCSPTRTGLMTGRCWSRYGVTTPQNERALPWDTVTLPRALKTVGYDTCLTGKWHLGSLPEQGPNHFGFDHSYGSLAGGVSPWSHGYKEGAFSKTWHRNETLVEERGHVTDLIAEEAVRWIKARGDAPFFLYAPFTAVHLPVKEPEEWVARVPASISGEVARHYAASIMHLDDAVGRILAALEKKGRRHNAIVIFTSDNGGSTAENNDRKYPDDQCPNGPLPGNNRPLRGEKGSVYEGGIRAPTLLSWPARLKPGRYDGTAQITDWMPTLCALAGAVPTIAQSWDGRNLWPQISGAEPVRERAIYTVGPGFRARALHEGGWKLVLTRKGAGKADTTSTEKVELFHLTEDPNETTDLAARLPEKVTALRARLEQMAAADRDSVVRD